VAEAATIVVTVVRPPPLVKAWAEVGADTQPPAPEATNKAAVQARRGAATGARAKASAQPSGAEAPSPPELAAVAAGLAAALASGTALAVGHLALQAYCSPRAPSP
jgi:hypothetical protein